ncbi:MAG: tyrosine-type recombinase/integrase [Armatimonadota bacterium]|nr:tyrosine-type recombinase/integrase [Armatimonadota bacterium]MDW8143927.1 tyrosine-type recombinase/integrase [Armatimonadota bacterium]
MVAKQLQTQLTPSLDWEKAIEVFLWAKQIAGRSSKTLEWFSQNLRMFTKFHSEEGLHCPSPTSCQPHHIQLYLARLQSKGLSSVSVHTYFIAISVFFSWLHKEGIIAENPCSKVAKPKARHPIPKPVTEEHFQKAISTLNPSNFHDLRNLALFMLAFDSGARVSELLGLKIGDVDLLQRVAKVIGKGGKERFIYFGAKTAQVLRKYLTQRALLHSSISQDEPLFVFKNGSPLDKRYVLRAWHGAQKRAGLKPLSFHSLRHGFARVWLLNGGEGFSLQLLLGHSTTAMTSRYVRLWATDLQKLHAKFSPVDRLKDK